MDVSKRSATRQGPTLLSHPDAPNLGADEVGHRAGRVLCAHGEQYRGRNHRVDPRHARVLWVRVPSQPGHEKIEQHRKAHARNQQRPPPDPVRREHHHGRPDEPGQVRQEPVGKGHGSLAHDLEEGRAVRVDKLAPHSLLEPEEEGGHNGAAEVGAAEEVEPASLV
jgi:hypothetical protein